MLLEDLYRRLSYGELSNLALSSEGSGSILEGAQPRIVVYAEEALVRLYSTFILKTKSVILTPLDHITHYHLKKRFAFSQRNVSNEDFYYIQDLDDEPFAEDVIKVLEVFDEVGNEVPLNDAEQPLSVFTPQALMLQVPTAWNGQVLSLLYQASHPKLDARNPRSIIELPDVLDGALTAFIAHKVHSHMNTMESSAKAQEHLSTFTGICTDVVDKDLVATSILRSNSRFHKRGWI
jgi:hypothetical protein